MTTENSQSEAQSDTEASSAPAAELPGEAPKLNREQRRAQSKGKQTATSGFHPSNTAKKSFGGARPANAPIQNKIPRTGHK
jgi:hypothetical protein